MVLGWVALLVLVAAVGLWLYGGRALTWFGDGIDVGAATGEASPELAREAEARLRSFAAGEGPDSMTLGTPALQSLVRYRSEGYLPAGVSDPEIHLADSTAVVGGTIRFRELATAEAARQVQSFLGDTAVVRAEVVPVVLRPAVGELRVLAMEAGDVAVPAIFIPTVLRRSGLPVEDGRPRSVVFEIPRGLTGVAVRDSQLVLRRAPSGGS